VWNEGAKKWRGDLPPDKAQGEIFGASLVYRFFIDNLLVRINFIVQMIWWTGLAPRVFGASLVYRFFFFFTLVTGPIRSLSLKLSL